VVERLRFEKFDLLAYIHSGPLAIAYAAQHPERPSHLVLCSAYARGSDFIRSPEVRGARRAGQGLAYLQRRRRRALLLWAGMNTSWARTWPP
jgi:pimeloyl-ACP methyl ester carboxylesterase